MINPSSRCGFSGCPIIFRQAQAQVPPKSWNRAPSFQTAVWCDWCSHPNASWPRQMSQQCPGICPGFTTCLVVSTQNVPTSRIFTRGSGRSLKLRACNPKLDLSIAFHKSYRKNITNHTVIQKKMGFHSFQPKKKVYHMIMRCFHSFPMKKIIKSPHFWSGSGLFASLAWRSWR